MKERFGLYLIATNPVAGYEAVARAAVACRVRYLQLRMKDEPKEAFIETARMYRNITRGTATRFIVNDDLETAVSVDADGIHLGQADLSLAEARRQWNMPGKIFGLSTHSLAQATEALKVNPDYIGIGPVYPTRTKTDTDPVLGPEQAGRIAGAVPITSVAIGGITQQNLVQLLACGLENYGVVGAVNSSADPAMAIHTLQKMWKMHGF
jgi:thiamine-phosphate pyrophosphorylase